MGICGADAPGRADVVPSRGQLVVCHASRYLRELSGLSVSASSVRRSANRAADRRLAGDSRAAEYRTSRGHDEFRPTAPASTDQGWGCRGRVAKRMPGARRASRVGHAGFRSGGRVALRPWDHRTLPPAGRWWLAAGDSRRAHWMSGRSGALDLGRVDFHFALRGHVGHLPRWACRPDRPGASAGRRRQHVGAADALWLARHPRGRPRVVAAAPPPARRWPSAPAPLFRSSPPPLLPHYLRRLTPPLLPRPRPPTRPYPRSPAG